MHLLTRMKRAALLNTWRRRCTKTLSASASHSDSSALQQQHSGNSVLSPQAESLWLHLPIITELATMCHRVFEGGSVQYAYTTIPTYPRSGFADFPRLNDQTVSCEVSQAGAFTFFCCLGHHLSNRLLEH